MAPGSCSPCLSARCAGRCFWRCFSEHPKPAWPIHRISLNPHQLEPGARQPANSRARSAPNNHQPPFRLSCNTSSGVSRSPCVYGLGFLSAISPVLRLAFRRSHPPALFAPAPPGSLIKMPGTAPRQAVANLFPALLAGRPARDSDRHVPHVGQCHGRHHRRRTRRRTRA